VSRSQFGLSAAFGSGTDWETSAGEDRYRRALYTTWRRSNPYPSMSTFDAPNREVCQVRRERSNTPLQALVTLNDPVYIDERCSIILVVERGASRFKIDLNRVCHRRLRGIALIIIGDVNRLRIDISRTAVAAIIWIVVVPITPSIRQ